MSLVLQSPLPHPYSCRGTSPHQQEWDTKMAHLSHGGIDVASDRLDVMLLPEGQCFWVGNNAAGWAELVSRLRGVCIAAIGIEASGGYERGVTRALLAAGISVRQINPFKLRQFAKASGVLAKNDRLDARMIALFVATMPTRPAQRNEAAERVAEVVTAGGQLRREGRCRECVEAVRRCEPPASVPPPYYPYRVGHRTARQAARRDGLRRYHLGQTLSAPDLDAGCWSSPRAHSYRVAAGTWRDEPQAGRRHRRARAL